MDKIYQWKVERETFLNELSSDPDWVLNNIQTYISLNNPQICCLLTANKCALPEFIQQKIVSFPEISVQYRKGIPQGFIKYQSIINSTNSCGFGAIKNAYFVGSDRFTNEMLIAYFLQYIYNDSPLPAILNYYTSTVCGNPSNMPNVPDVQAYINEPIPNIYEGASKDEPNSLLSGSVRLQGLTPYQISLYQSPPYERPLQGIFLIEKPVMGRLDQLVSKFPEYGERLNVDGSIYYIVRPKVTLEIFKQLTIILDSLRDFLFEHGNLTIDKIMVVDEPVDFDVEGIPIQSDFICKLSDFSMSSITVPLGHDHIPHHFYPRVPQLEDIYLNTPEFSPFIDTYNRTPVYVLNNSFTNTMLSQIRGIGLPFYSSFDVYTLFLSIFLIPQFHYSVFDSNTNLKKLLWDPLWFPVDREVMYNRVVSLMNRGSSILFDDIVTILRNIRLKCNVTDDLIVALGGIR